MTMYNPHRTPDIVGEMSLMASKGRLVKARLSDQNAPNVSWYWIHVGNCYACKYMEGTECANPNISRDDFLHKYMTADDCPEFEAGVDPSDASRADLLDVMRAAGVANGKPSQRVEVIVDEPWSVELAMRAHREQSTFLHMAAQADSGSKNEEHRGEYVDLSDDLERDEPDDDVVGEDEDEPAIIP